MTRITCGVLSAGFILLGAGGTAFAQSAADRAALGDGFGVYEWGLVSFHSSNQAELATSAHDYVVPVPYEMMPITVDKPVIYLVPGSGFDSNTSIDVTVNIEGGRLYEVWPGLTASGPLGNRDSFSWTDLQVTNEACSGPDTAPGLESTHCSMLVGGVCEAAEIAAYVDEIDHCLEVSGVRVPLLLYNGYPEFGTSAPVMYDAFRSEVVNISMHRIGPVYYVHDEPDDTLDPTVFVFDSLESSARAGLGDASDSFPLAGGGSALTQRVREDLTEQGLPESFAAHFVDAWTPGPLSSEIAFHFLGFYDREYIDAAFPLQVSPEPAATVRVLGFAVD